MSHALIQLALFASKTVIIFLFILLVLIAFFTLIAKSKDKSKGRLVVKNINKKYAETKESMLAETLPKKQFKAFLKEQKKIEKAQLASEKTQKNIFVINFIGDTMATAVNAMREEITAILNIATPKDEVVLRLESAGGAVHAYGLAAAQLIRIRTHQIPLTITVDKVAASGGYLMACVGNKILSSPFAIVGSIGVIVQLPNFHRLLKHNHVDFEQITAGDYKRTISLFGENTSQGRDKLKEEIEDVHHIFKQLIQDHRQQIDIQKVSTGEHWLGTQALDLKLVDDLKTSDEYLLDCSKEANLYEVCYEMKKPFLSRLSASANLMREKLLNLPLFQ